MHMIQKKTKSEVN
jgi:predicted Zn-ribbon and HTH transcriptional regulator